VEEKGKKLDEKERNQKVGRQIKRRREGLFLLQNLEREKVYR